MVSCCSGAELTVIEDDRAAVRELYPDRESLHERARQLRDELEGQGWSAGEP